MWPAGASFTCRRGISSSAAALPSKKWDSVVIGGGHNGLTSAAYLARAGFSVAVLEGRHVIGGAVVTEEIVPGFRFSRCSYLQGLLRPSLIKEPELGRHGLKLLKRNPSSFTPFGMHWLTRSTTTTDTGYEKQLKMFCEFMDSPTPEVRRGNPSFIDRVKDEMQKSAFWGRCLRQTYGLGLKDLLYVEGGMGSVSLAISNTVREAGSYIVTDAELCSLGCPVGGEQ